MNGYLLDANIITALIKRELKIIDKIERLPTNDMPIFISVITYYEIERGLIAVNATRKLEIFNNFLDKYQILFLDDLNIAKKASQIYANLKRRGCLIQDADILIAATAIIHNLILVSNDSDLLRVEELILENWLV